MNREAHRRLRTTFDEEPDQYERARPAYPAKLFDDLVDLAQLSAGAQLVEVGCGTGQATVPLAVRGFQITCVELGAQLAAVAREKLAAFPNVDVINTSFEAWQPGHAAYDAVVAFTAFHWIDPELRYPKSASLLRDAGALAVAAVNHVLPEGGDSFFLEVQEDYEAVVPDDPKTRAGAPGAPEAVTDLSEEIDASGLFENVAARRYVWDVPYTPDEYIALLDTYSGHRALPTPQREELYSRIHRRVSGRPGAAVRKTYLATLNVARRSPSATQSPERDSTAG